MLAIPEIDRADVIFGNITHMPKYADIPSEFKDGNTFTQAVSFWFFKGGKVAPQGILIEDMNFTPKPGVNQSKALAAIKAVLGSFEPKHEHKIAACGFMLSEWFDLKVVQREKAKG